MIHDASLDTLIKRLHYRKKTLISSMRVSLSFHSLVNLFVFKCIFVEDRSQVVSGFVSTSYSLSSNILNKNRSVEFPSLSMKTSSSSLRNRSPSCTKEGSTILTPSTKNYRSSTLLLTPRRQNNNESDTQDNIGIISVVGVVLPLLLVYISNQWSRSSIYYLVDFSSHPSTSTIDSIPSSFYAMNLDIGFDQAQYGLLASLGFTALYAITSLFAGNLADKYNRKYLTIGSTLVWAVATYTTSIASTYDEVFISRVVMGLACAFTTPCAYTLLKDFVNNSKLGFANSLYGSGVYFGGGLSSLSILLDDKLGWRNTCGTIAAYGVVAAIITTLALPNDPKQASLLVPESEYEQSLQLDSDKLASSSSDNNGIFTDVQQIIISNKRLQWLFLGSFSRFCSGLCIGVWAAPYYKLAFPDDSTSYAVINALIVGICGVLSGILGGYFSDKSIGISRENEIGEDEGEYKSLLSCLDQNGARLIVPIIGSLLAVPSWWLTSHASTFDSAMFWLAIEYLVAECWFGPIVAVLQSEVKQGQGGIAQGMFALTGAIGNLAPSLLGLIYSRQILGDGGTSGNEILSSLLGIGVCGGYLVSALCFGLCAMTPTSSNYELVKNK